MTSPASPLWVDSQGTSLQILRALLKRVLALLQDFLKGDHVVMADTGDCIFWTQQLKLPYGAGWVPVSPSCETPVCEIQL